jgi:cytochrome P450
MSLHAGLVAFRDRAAVTARGQDIVGEVLAALALPEGRADPYPLYERLREQGPATTGPDGTLVITGYRECSMLLRDHRLHKTPERLLALSGYPHWQDRPSLRLMFTSILMLNPPAHTRLRRLVSALFTARRMAGLRPAVERIVADACDQIVGDSDFVAGFAFPLPVSVIGELLGVPAADRPMFAGLARDWTAVLDVLSPQVVDRADAAAAAIGDYLSDLAAQRQEHPADDLISAMVTATHGGDKLTTDELVTMAALLLAAGFETTTGLLSNGLLALLAHPDQADLLRTGSSLAIPAVEELLRYDSPVQMLFGRSAPDELTVAGLDLSEGQWVLVMLGAANRDPAVFSDPDRLILDRAQQAPLSFGGGVHYCLGAPLARLEAQVAFPALLARFPRLALAGEPVCREGIAVHGHTSLPITAALRPRRRRAGPLCHGVPWRPGRPGGQARPRLSACRPGGRARAPRPPSPTATRAATAGSAGNPQWSADPRRARSCSRTGAAACRVRPGGGRGRAGRARTDARRAALPGA